MVGSLKEDNPVLKLGKKDFMKNYFCNHIDINKLSRLQSLAGYRTWHNSRLSPCSPGIIAGFHPIPSSPCKVALVPLSSF
uniref:Uncharacterized protein n=1 Tax=Arundo donax TaxID=35708 RepID=A0A0A9CPY0_ARUDO